MHGDGSKFKRERNTDYIKYCSRGSLYDVLNNAQIEVGWERALKFASEMAAGMKVLHTFEPPIFHR